jgi:hypothetical protein
MSVDLGIWAGIARREVKVPEMWALSPASFKPVLFSHIIYILSMST